MLTVDSTVGSKYDLVEAARIVFPPYNGRRPLTYHCDMERWWTTGNWTELRAVAKGQEFILDCDEYPEAIAWLSGLFRSDA